MSTYSVVGKRIPRIDGEEMATGRSVYADDLKFPGLLYGRILRSPHGHARIKRVDTHRAEQLPGVRAVITAEDVPDLSVFAREKVHYMGQQVAAVAADDPDVAEDALDLIEVEYEVLPAAVDPLEASKPDAPLVREDMEPEEVFVEDGVELKNIAGRSEETEGDVEKGFRESDFVFEHTFRTPIFHQTYMEPNAATARVEPSGRITVWTTAQGSFAIRSQIAASLKISVGQLKVIVTQVGGGFGGKNRMSVENVCVLLAQRTASPVRIVLTRKEVFLATFPGPACVSRVKTGVKKDGTLMALEARCMWDAGAFGGARGAERLRGLYRVPNFRLVGYGVYTNKLQPGAYRAPGSPQIAFVRETNMDLIARELGMDPVAFRLKNAVGEGDISVRGTPLSRPMLQETLRKAAETAEWEKRPVGKHRGRGIACGEWTNGCGASGVYVTVNEDGTVAVTSGSVDITGTNTIFAQIAAEELGVPVEKISVSVGDTDTVPYANLSAGSRTAYATGSAVRIAAQEVRDRLFRMASEILGVSQEKLEAADGGIRIKGSPDESVSIAELATAGLTAREGPIAGMGTVSSIPTHPSFAVQVAEVEVDPETGKVALLKFNAAQDVGFALNPSCVEGQMRGGATQGIGYGMMEGYLYGRNGELLNPNLLDYKIPTALDTPNIGTVLVEAGNPDGPYGAKGVGEPPIIPSAAAIANAVYDAVGVMITDLPITPEKVVRALREKLQRRRGR